MSVDPPPPPPSNPPPAPPPAVFTKAAPSDDPSTGIIVVALGACLVVALLAVLDGITSDEATSHALGRGMGALFFPGVAFGIFWWRSTPRKAWIALLVGCGFIIFLDVTQSLSAA